MSESDGGVATTMRVAVYEAPGKMGSEARPVPSPGPGQVLVEVDHCGICGSDVHMIQEGWTSPGAVLGHEWSGRVVALGPGGSRWTVGQAVVGGPGPRCGSCRRCLDGQPSQCERREHGITDHTDGAFARYTLASELALRAVPQGLSLRDAALAEPLAVALHGVNRSGWTARDSVMVLGAGPIGALTIALLHHRGAGDIVVVEPAESRKALAVKLGAGTVLDPSDLELYPRWEPERISPTAVDIVLECSGKKAAVEAGYCQLRRGGTLALVGAGNQVIELDPNRMILNELHLCGSFVYDVDGFERALDLLASGALPTELLIEPQDVPIDRVGQAVLELGDGRLAGKAMVIP